MIADDRVLAGLFEGDNTPAISAREAEESWRIVEPVLDAFRKGKVPLCEYRAGSSDPLITCARQTGGLEAV